MFVVFEGIDGSGKTTVSNRVAERLRESGVPVTHLRAEGKFVSAVSESIRELGRDARNLELEPEAEFLLYVARDVQLIQQALRPALARGDVVLADRFLYTAEVLGRCGRHLSRQFVDPILAAAAGGLEPDLVVLVDVDPTLARARRKAFKIEVVDPRPPSRKGLSGVGLQHRIRRGYLELAAERRDRWVVVENEESLDETLARVTELLLEARARGASAAISRFQAQYARGPRTAAPMESVEQALSAFLRFIDARLEREPRVAAYLLGGLSGPGIDERRRVLAERVPKAVLAALSGMDDAASWEFRDALAAEYPQAVAATLGGLPADHPRAAALRAQLLPRATVEVLASLSRSDDPAAWELRERFYPEHPSVVVQGLGGLASERAWALRERFLEATRSERATRYDLSRVAARSVTALDDERAWLVREEARAVSPVAAVGSLSRVLSAKSFAWRREYLTRAPKVVMGTLRNVALPESWELRRRVIADCKEALDSIDGIDAVEAWQLREEYADHWPSTAVKTLGPLADGERGRALVERQLRVHPGNISLLKHVAAIALGVHRVAVPTED